jgi:hypothetical protein
VVGGHGVLYGPDEVTAGRDVEVTAATCRKGGPGCGVVRQVAGQLQGHLGKDITADTLVSVSLPDRLDRTAIGCEAAGVAWAEIPPAAIAGGISALLYRDRVARN